MPTSSLLLLLLIPLCSAVTMEEAAKDPDKFILYDQSSFNIPMHAGIALVIAYSILVAIIVLVFAITKIFKIRKPGSSA